MIKPLGENVLLKVHRMQETALLLVDERDAETEKATVIDVGDECTKLKKDDIVYFKDYDTSKVLEGNESLTIIKEENVLGLHYESHT